MRPVKCCSGWFVGESEIWVPILVTCQANPRVGRDLGGWRGANMVNKIRDNVIFLVGDEIDDKLTCRNISGEIGNLTEKWNSRFLSSKEQSKSEGDVESAGMQDGGDWRMERGEA